MSACAINQKAKDLFEYVSYGKAFTAFTNGPKQALEYRKDANRI